MSNSFLKLACGKVRKAWQSLLLKVRKHCISSPNWVASLSAELPSRPYKFLEK
jgi:hypothetical protein